MKTVTFRPGKVFKGRLQGLSEGESTVSKGTIGAVVVALVLGFAAGYSWGVPDR